MSPDARKNNTPALIARTPARVTKESAELTEEALRRAVRVLVRRDPDLAMIHRTYGVPPLWAREPGFATLVHLILEQQVSLASARACFDKLRALLPGMEPAGFLELSDITLREAGFSRQKSLYCREMARAVVEGRFDIPALHGLEDTAVMKAMTELKGVGTWTANVYLLMVMRRPDAFPASDLALLIAAQRVKRLRKRPTPERLEAIAESWRPYRSVAARLLWLYYLSAPKVVAKG